MIANVLVSLIVLLFATTQAPVTPPSVSVPATRSKTPQGCMVEVRAYATAKTQALAPTNRVSLAWVNGVLDSPGQTQARQINATQIAMAKQCAAQFDATTVADKDLASLAELYVEAQLNDQAKTVIDRALPLKIMAPVDRATFLSMALPIVSSGKTPTPPGDARSWREANVYPRLEAIVDEIDGSRAATFNQKLSAHEFMLNNYLGNDFDAGIITHVTWFRNVLKTLTPEQRMTHASTLLASCTDVAEALANHGVTEQAIALLKQGEAAYKTAKNDFDPEIARLELVGTTATPISAPHWLNVPAGTKDLPMTGAVTLLEFSAHWCGSCRVSYPGLNRLREKYGPQGFRVVIATQLYGYFAAERPLDAAAEIDRDTTYFREQGLDVPIAIGDLVAAGNTDGTRTTHRDPNDDAYRVGGIPQIQIIDKHGIIRRLMMGYDNANETTLAALIETLLKEK